ICDACHGPGARGEQRLQTPGLVGQPEVYLLRQLRNFRGGRRGANNDVEGQQMRQILEVISNEEDWQDVVRYIGSLPPQAPPATPTRAETLGWKFRYGDRYTIMTRNHI